MPPTLALILSFVFIASLLLFEKKHEDYRSIELWVPQIWLLLLTSRSFAYWINFGKIGSYNPEDYLEGNPVNRAFLLFMISLALLVLINRRVNIVSIILNNQFLFLFLVYCGFSAMWSDYPIVSFKRWIKEVGNILMILIIVTENNPSKAIKILYRRVAYIHLPLSIVFIKYFPDLGRVFSRSGEVMYSGVTGHKNSLGVLATVLFIMLLWDFAAIINQRKSSQYKSVASVYIILMLMSLWLLNISNSATSILTCIIGVGIFFLLGRSIVKNNLQSLFSFVLLTMVIFCILQLFIDLPSLILNSLGRDSTLTGRTQLWKEVLEIDINPIIGTGYEGFWLGERLEFFSEKYWWRPNQAHNGYLEIYLNLGYIGCSIFLILLIGLYRNITSRILFDFDFQRLRLTFYFVLLLMNLTEGYFLQGPSNAWFLFLLITMNIPLNYKSI
jgi:O-antigen ligase